MKAAIYARYSSDSQRPESIDDQVAACRRFAAEKGIEVLEDHVYSDSAQSGALKDRPSLNALMEAAANGAFDLTLVDDFARLARDSLLQG